MCTIFQNVFISIELSKSKRDQDDYVAKFTTYIPTHSISKECTEFLACLDLGHRI